MKKEKYVAYYRVSTQRQGQSGLGLEAQKEEIQRTISGKELIRSFTDIESGKKANRPELEKALAFCKKEDATLIIAKLDRLSRDVGFIFNLRDSGVKFKACDLPDLNTVTLGVFASFAQYEREKISERTSAALQAKLKRDGKWWGKANLTPEARKKGAEATRELANRNLNNQRAMAYIEMMIPKHYTLEQMANELNNSGFKTSRGKEFTPMQVSRLKKRIDLCRVD
mgnify:CR=1 FL=1